MKRTWYIVQTARGYVVGNATIGWRDNERMARKAARISLEKARQVHRRFRDETCAEEDRPRRFPRIIKVTVETKTIKEG